MMLAYPSGGVMFGLPIAAVLFLIGVAAVIYGLVIRRSRYPEDGWPPIIGGFIWGFLVLAATAVLFWPYKWEYHSWNEKAGVVESVSNRFLPAGDRSVEQKFVVTLRGDPHPYGISDTRAALLKPGDKVSISCKRTWQFASGDHGYDCRWGGMR